MWVAVADGLVLMPMRMPERRGLLGMAVIMMFIVMAVHMNVLHFLMVVMMGMLVVHQKVNGQSHYAAGKKLRQG